MARVLDRALLKCALKDLMPDDRVFDEWMDRPNEQFGGKRPRTMIRTTSGRETLWKMVRRAKNAVER